MSRAPRSKPEAERYVARKVASLVDSAFGNGDEWLFAFQDNAKAHALVMDASLAMVERLLLESKKGFRHD